MLLSSDMSQHELRGENTCEISNTGRIFCYPRVMTQIICRQRLERWPFDEQKCSVGFISYAHNRKLISLELNDKVCLRNLIYLRQKNIIFS
jgi:hypothetical protein